MKINFYPQLQTFQSNTGYYKAENGNTVETYTKMFRTDLDWERFTDYMVKHFRDKEDVQFIQFGSSDGSEAYTQIITLLENYKDVDKFFPIKAFDINKEICDVAKSRIVNVNNIDKKKFEERRINLEKYFTKTNDNLQIQNDKLNNPESYKVKNILANKVIFKNEDMMNILNQHEDNSNTVIMCRNILLYFSDREVDRFANLAGCNLQKGSLVVIGDYDNPRADEALQIRGFTKVMHNVYRKD